MTEYLVRFANQVPSFNADWNDPVWQQAQAAVVEHFRPESSPHRPRTQVRLLHDTASLQGIFQVEDRFVRCVRTRFMDEVWKDSCVEVFIQPKAGQGYFNFEFNCGGAFLCCHITDPTRVPGGFKAFVPVPEASAAVRVATTLPPVTEPEQAGPLTWALQFVIPFQLLEKYTGPIALDTPWRGNFFKCSEENSHPHWASWSPVDEFNFHLPRCFGTFRFEVPIGPDSPSGRA